MDFDSCFQLGYIIKSHGLNGEVSVFLDTDEPFAYQELESIFVEQDQRLIPFFVTSLKIQKNKAVVAFEGVNNIDRANELKGARLWLPLEFLPPLKGNQFYFHEIIGFTVVDESKGEIGKIASVYDSGAQNLLAVDHKGKEILIPIVDSIIKKVDRLKNTLTVEVPEGLIELYTSEDEN